MRPYLSVSTGISNIWEKLRKHVAQFLLLHRKEPGAAVILYCVLVIDQEFYLHARGKVPNLGLTQVYRVQHLNLHVHCTLNYVLLIKNILSFFRLNQT